jgi:GT2 family glycosyltransferase
VLESEPSAPGSDDQVSALELEYGSWLSPSALLLVGALGGIEGAEPQAFLEASGESQALTASWLAQGTSPAGGATVGMLALVAPQLQVLFNGAARLTIEAAGTTLKLGVDELEPGLIDPEIVVRRNFAHREVTERNRVIAFLAATTARVPRIETYTLGQRLLVIREALRRHLPTGAPSEGRTHAFHVDRVLAVDDRSFYFEGWIHDAAEDVVRLTAISPEGSRAELLGKLFRFVRPDVDAVFSAQGPTRPDKRGFVCFIELDAPSVVPEGWVIELESATGMVIEVAGPHVVSDTLAVRDTILSGPFDQFPNQELMTGHVHPAVSRIQQRSVAVPRVEEVVQFGSPPSSPEVSVVVPVYERLDHLEMQLAEFVHDPEMSQADLIYVLDSPEHSDEFRSHAAQLAEIYRVPFRVAVLEQNVGFAGATNAGASLAQGRLLLLLNSDTLPVRPGWVSTMREFYDSVPDIGALGPKMLYEDDSIQHAGMYYYQPPGSSVWVDAHYFKGMHRDLPAANVARAVPLVSGACLMVDRSLYEEVGGLRDTYLRGDYEDSDFCLQLLERGRANWYAPTVEIYHLEGQSYSPSAQHAAGRAIVNRYNMWLHTQVWGDRIEQLMGEMNGSLPEEN